MTTASSATKFVLARTPHEKKQCLDIRVEVFVKEQGFTLEQEVDEYESLPSTLHFALLQDTSRKPLGALRVLPMAGASGDPAPEQRFRLGRLAVPESLRGLGYGRLLMQGAHDYFQDLARENGKQLEVCLHAQLSKIAFYRKFGYTTEGVEFMEDGQPHQNMVKTITP